MTSTQTIHDALHFRYATKQFDTTKKLSDETVHQILEAGRLAPSSFGLQPWKFVLVNDADTRTKLRAAGYDQPQITDASHLVIITHKTTMDEAYVDAYMKSTADARRLTPEDLAGFKATIMGSVERLPTKEAVSAWNARQTYIPLGIMLESAALMEIDACPMEGFDPSKFNEILGLTEMGYSAVAIMALGYRKEEDPMAHVAKSRFPFEEVVLTK